MGSHKPRPREPVVLERVMAGEVFTAVLGGGPKSAAPQGSDLPAPEPIRGQPDHVPDDERARTLNRFAGLLRDEGSDAASQFDTYATPIPATSAGLREEDETEVIEGAREALRGWRASDGLRILEEAVQRGARSARVWLLIGEACLSLDRLREAGGAFYRALKAAPTNEFGWLGLAKVLRRLDHVPAAFDAVERALHANPKLPEAWTERGIALERMGRLPDALQSFRKSLELQPHQSFVRAKRLELETRLIDVGDRNHSVWGAPPAGREPTVPGAPTDRPMPAVRADASAPSDRSGGKQSLALLVPDIASEASGVTRTGARGGSERESEHSAAPRHPARAATYVDGLDELLHGGIPWGHVVLVQGLPGTMKSSLCLYILAQHAARAKHRCLYLSLEERSKSLQAQMASLGLRFDGNQNGLLLVDRDVMRNVLVGGPSDAFTSLREAIESIHDRQRLDVLAIDCLQAAAHLGDLGARRGETHRIFDWFRDLDTTTFIVSEGPDLTMAVRPSQLPEEYYLADGIFQLRVSPASDYDVERQLRVLKMRGTNHGTGYHALLFDRGRFRVRRSSLA